MVDFLNSFEGQPQFMMLPQIYQSWLNVFTDLIRNSIKYHLSLTQLLRSPTYNPGEGICSPHCSVAFHKSRAFLTIKLYKKNTWHEIVQQCLLIHAVVLKVGVLNQQLSVWLNQQLSVWLNQQLSVWLNQQLSVWLNTIGYNILVCLCFDQHPLVGTDLMDIVYM